MIALEKTSNDFQVISGTSSGTIFSGFGMDFKRILVLFSVISETSGFLLAGTGTRAGMPPSKVGTHSFQDFFMPFRNPGPGRHFS